MEYITGDHTIYLIRDFLPPDIETDVINRLESESAFNSFTINGKPLCRTGCFEGDQYENESVPWLRCPCTGGCSLNNRQGPSIEQQPVYPWNPTMKTIKDYIEGQFECELNIGKLQKYKNGDAIIKSHVDKILDLDETTPIFIIRFGAPRTFVLTHKLTDLTISFKMPHNSLLVITYEGNLIWRHAVAKNPQVHDPSWSIVYRKSVTYKQGEYIWGNRTPFNTVDELNDYIVNPDKYDHLLDYDTYNKELLKCFAEENSKVCDLDLYKNIMLFSPYI